MLQVPTGAERGSVFIEVCGKGELLFSHSVLIAWCYHVVVQTRGLDAS